MLSEAVAHYHKLLADEELARTSLALLDEGLECAKLMFGGRRLSPYLRPHFVSEEDFARVQNICETVWGAIEKPAADAQAPGGLLRRVSRPPAGSRTSDRDRRLERYADAERIRTVPRIL